MSNPIAVYSGNTVVYWSAVIISLGLLSALMMTLSLQRTNRGSAAAVWLFVPLAVIFSVPLCRALHWYCHQEQYASLLAALRDYSSGSYVLSGALPGVLLAALIASPLNTRSTASLLDAFAPGAALSVAFIRLSALFNSSCRSKISVNTPILQHLPLAAGIVDSSGQVEYRFATFFLHFLLMLFLCRVLLGFFYSRRNVPMVSGNSEGNVARMFLLFYSATELVVDSTRYDSSFLPINGFVSFVQIVAAVSIFAVLIYYSIHSVRANGFRWYHIALWAFWLATLGAAGYTEYLVQRHGDWYLSCYFAMGLACILNAGAVYRMYLSCCEEPED